MRYGLAASALLVAAWLVSPPPAEADPPILFVEGVPLRSGLRTLLVNEATSAHEKESAWFGTELTTPVTIRWITDGDELRGRTGREPGTIAGAAVPARGEIILFAPALMSRSDRIASVMRHEMCHLLLARATSHAEVEPPRWLDEGIATWRSLEWDLDLSLRRDQSAWIRDAAAARHLFRFEELDARFPQGPLMPLAYAQSASFVEWLARRNGDTKLRELLQALDRDQDAEVAIQATWGLSLGALEREWRRDVGGGWLAGVPSFATLSQVAGLILGVLVVAAWIRRRRRLARLPDEDVDPADAG